MNIELLEITIRDLVEGYENNEEAGVLGYNETLDIRPPYQREFVYSPKQQEAVVTTVNKGFPLNVMYWAAREDGNFEVIDGQQRTLSICEYVDGSFAYEGRYFYNLAPDEQDKFLDYKLMIYVCSGTQSEKLEWFETINIAGEKLTDQELRNAVYSGSFVTDAKRYFSKSGCVAYMKGSAYMSGSAIRQDYLQTTLKWISADNGNNDDENIKEYMALHQHDVNAAALWRYCESVITWVEQTFTKKRAVMKSVNWGELYNEFKDEILNAAEIEKEVARLIADDDVSKKAGIYPYILTRDEKYLSIRAFTDSVKQKVFEKQEGVCPICYKRFGILEMEADHIDPWHEGGKTDEENCQMLCKQDNRRKSGK